MTRTKTVTEAGKIHASGISVIEYRTWYHCWMLNPTNDREDTEHQQELLRIPTAERTKYQQEALDAYAQFTDAKRDIDADLWATTLYKRDYSQPLSRLKKELNLKSPVIYAPGHGTDISHCEVFYREAGLIVNLEVNPLHTDLFRRLYKDDNHIISKTGFAERFVPPREVDLMLELGRAYTMPAALYRLILQPGAYVVRTFVSGRRDPLFKFEGCFDESGWRSPQEFDSRVSNDHELKMSRPNSRFATYKDVIAAVYRATNCSDNLVARYNAMRETALEQEIENLRTKMGSPERKIQMKAAGLEEEEPNSKVLDDMRNLIRDGKLRLRCMKDHEILLKPLPLRHNNFKLMAIYRYLPDAT